MTFCRRLLACLFLGLCTLPASAEDRPNFILVLADDLGWTDLACYGGDLHETPHLDRLARAGMKFTNAYAACTVCSPTRAAVLTGKYPARLHVTDYIPGHERPHAKLRIPAWTKRLELDHVTFAELLQTRGYKTAHVGKWHLGPESHYPQHQGFDVNVAGTSAGSPPGGYFLPNQLSLPNAQHGEYLTDRLTDEAIQLIESWRDQPFFLYLPAYAVHTPIQGKPDLTAHYANKIEPAHQHRNAQYAAMVHNLDENVGRILTKLDELGLSERTVVIFTSDNGGLSHIDLRPTGITSNEPLRRGKGSAYEGGVRVPLIVRGPGVAQDTVCDEPVISMDFLPTIAAMAGVKNLDSLQPLDGVSLTPVLKDPEAALDRPALYWHYPHYHRGGDGPYSAVRAGDWKLIEYLEEGRLELFDLRNDLGEQHNLAAEQPAKVRELLAQLNQWRDAVDAQMPTENPDYDPQRASEAAPRRQPPAKTKNAATRSIEAETSTTLRDLTAKQTSPGAPASNDSSEQSAAKESAPSRQEPAKEQAQQDRPDVRQLQAQAVQAGRADWGHWGANTQQYSSWTNHSSRLIPVYTYGISLDEVRKANHYHDAERLKSLYGRVPDGTLNPEARYFDQTAIYDLQKQAFAAGKKYIILVVFDGMDWQTTAAAAYYQSGKVYREGRGSGLLFQDYQGVETDFGFFVTSPYSNSEGVDVDAQTVADVSRGLGGGYDATLGGATPWVAPADPQYLLGRNRRRPDAVTDSASSATSLTAGIKTYNAAINVAHDGSQVVPIARELQATRGFSIGVVTSVPISHATPACAYANNVTRNDYQDLTRDLLGLPSIAHRDNPTLGVDVLIGAGWGETAQQEPRQGANYLPGNRFLAEEDLNRVNVATGGRYLVAQRTPGQNGAQVLHNAARQATQQGLRLFGFFGAKGGHLPFRTADGRYDPAAGVKKAEQYLPADIEENPTLADMARAALTVLEKDPEGFWLLVEPGDVDWANHDNNLDNSIGAVISGDNAFQAVVEWVESRNAWPDTAVIVTADHGHFFVLNEPEMLTGK